MVLDDWSFWLVLMMAMALGFVLGYVTRAIRGEGADE